MDLNLASALLQGYDTPPIFANLRRRGGCDQTPSREREREESESERKGPKVERDGHKQGAFFKKWKFQPGLLLTIRNASH
jgi:hypothetical protein